MMQTLPNLYRTAEVPGVQLEGTVPEGWCWRYGDIYRVPPNLMLLWAQQLLGLVLVFTVAFVVPLVFEMYMNSKKGLAVTTA
jgi:hypothetical protein